MLKGFDRATAVICTIAILNTMGLGLIMPVMPELLAAGLGGIALLLLIVTVKPGLATTGGQASKKAH